MMVLALTELPVFPSWFWIPLALLGLLIVIVGGVT